jgi:hypothetical protein
MDLTRSKPDLVPICSKVNQLLGYSLTAGSYALICFPL